MGDLKKSIYHWGEIVELSEAKTFTDGPHRRHVVGEGIQVEIRRVEPIFDDHGRFCRFWYHLRFPLTGWKQWSAIAEEEQIQKTGILDKLANL